jgi:rhamnulokinase
MPYLAFDLGASSGRAVIGRLRRGGRMETEEVHRFDTPVIEEERLFWGIEALWDELQIGLQKALDAEPDIESLSVDSWACDYVPLGADDRPLRNPYSYRDERTFGWMDRAFETVSPADIFDATGIQFLPFNTLYQLLADRDGEPDVFDATRRRLTIAEYVLWRFGGRPAIERSMASTTQLADPHRVEWNEDLMHRFALTTDAWPEIVPPGTSIGELRVSNDEFAGDAFANRQSPIANRHPERERGSTPGVRPERQRGADRSSPRGGSTPGVQSPIDIVAGLSHDTACAVAAVPAEGGSENWAYVSSGTWSLLGVERSAPILTDEAREAGFTNEAGLGGTTRFLKNLTGLWPLQECVREWREAGEDVSYDALFAEAEAIGPAEAEIDLEDERFLPRGGMEKRVKDYCRETGQPVPESRAALARAIVEGIAASYDRALDQLERLTGQSVDVLHVVGGGSKVGLLCRLAAEATGCRVVAGPAEATALGNLLVQADAAGALAADGTAESASVSARVRAAARRSARTTSYEPALPTR